MPSSQSDSLIARPRSDLDDDDADAVVAVLLPKLQRRSGLDVFTFRDVVSAILPFRPAGPLQ